MLLPSLGLRAGPCQWASPHKISRHLQNGSPVEGSWPPKQITRAELLYNGYREPNASPRSLPGVRVGSHSIGRRGGTLVRQWFMATLSYTAALLACDNGRERAEEEEGRDPRGANLSLGNQGPESRTPSPLPSVTPKPAVPVSACYS